MSLDPRRNAVRDDLADVRLRGEVDRPRYAEPTPFEVSAPVARCHRSPGHPTIETEFLHGEAVDVFASEGDGWVWAQSVADGYVGYVREAALAPRGGSATHRISVPRALVFAEPSIRARLVAALPLQATVRVAETLRDKEVFHRLAGEPARFILGQHLAPADDRAPDFVDVAQTFVGAPYLWGGKTWEGLDCSALVQLAAEAAGGTAPRDADMQEAELGAAVDPGEAKRRGDLVFWRGHVGIMVDDTRLLHANGHHMLTAVEPLADTVGRLTAMGLPVTSVRRLAEPR